MRSRARRRGPSSAVQAGEPPSLPAAPESAPVRPLHRAQSRVGDGPGLRRDLFLFHGSQANGKRSPYRGAREGGGAWSVWLEGSGASSFFTVHFLLVENLSTEDYCPDLFNKKWNLMVILKACDCTIRSIVSH